MKKGVPVSPGVAVAHAHVVQPLQAAHGGAAPLDAAALSGEVRRFERACAAAARDLDETIARVARQVNEDAAAIFRAHRLLLRDPTLTRKVTAAIRERRLDAAAALSQTLSGYQQVLDRIHDPVLRGRMDDLRDVANRILGHLALEAPAADHAIQEPVILVAEEVLPSQALTLDRRLIAGIATEKGGPTGHAAILARTLGIPAVSGLRDLLRDVRPGDLIALDGREGVIHVNPGPEAEAFYRKLQREYVALVGKLIENRDSPAVSGDGVAAELLANVNNAADAREAVQAGAGGVGLYRTEYLFLSHPTVPDEEDQVRAYREVIEAAPNRRVTIRTLDLGGDKQVPYLGSEDEPNPFMGFRSIRLSSAYPEFFATQLRAILRAALHGHVELLFPMVSTLEEVREVRKTVQKTQLALQRAGVPHGSDVPLGVMVEVPAAAVCIDELLREADFVSIGSNDLVQYLMAADRDNPKVAHLCEPFGPALLRVLAKVIKACNDQGKPVTLCGEMAGRPRCFLPLFGMGLRRLSMSPAFVPTMKEVVRHTTLAEAELVAQRVLRMSTAGEIRTYLANKLQQVWPSMQLLDLRR